MMGAPLTHTPLKEIQFVNSKDFMEEISSGVISSPPISHWLWYLTMTCPEGDTPSDRVYHLEQAGGTVEEAEIHS